MTPIPIGNKTSGSPKAASDVENMFSWLEFELTEKLFGCLTATNMKLVDRSQIVHGEIVNRLAKRPNAAADCSHQVTMGVVRGNVVLS